jgi:hypothetical protein
MEKNLKLLYMWQFLIGVGIGVYIGTYYNCNPQLNKLIEIINKSFPERKNDK